MVKPVAVEHLCERADDLFQDRFGGTPDGVWVAPGRVNLIGEHVDYIGAPTMPFALPYATAVAVRVPQRDELRLVSSDHDDAWVGRGSDIGPRQPTGWPGYVAIVAW